MTVSSVMLWNRKRFVDVNSTAGLQCNGKMLE